MAKLELKINPQYENLVPELSDFDYNKLRDSIKQNGLLEKIVVNQDYEILDGHHRYKFCQELGIELTEDSIDKRVFDNKQKEIEYVFNTNLERRHYNTFQRCQAGHNFKPHFERAVKEKEHKRKTGTLSEIRESPMHTHKSVAALVGVNPETYWYAQKVLESSYQKEYFFEEETLAYQPKLNALLSDLRNGEIGIETGYKKIEQWNELLLEEREKDKAKSDKEIMESLAIEIRPYNVWNIPRIDSRFGIKHPGNIPADIVFNVLYFFTKQGDTIVDPMAGGGVTGDVCKIMRRECKMFDVNPVREDIEKLDILKEGLPDLQSDLTFWDPPYFKKMQSEYGPSSISDLSRKQYLDVFAKAAKQLRQKTKCLALLISDYDVDSDTEEPIFIWDYVEIFKSLGWKPYRHIMCPLPTQQASAAEHKSFVEKRRLLRLSRSLVIFQ